MGSSMYNTKPDNTWFTKTITDMPDSVSEPLDQYLTETIEEPVLTKKWSKRMSNTFYNNCGAWLGY